MKTELVTVENQQVVTSSRNVADHFEKRHADVIEAIENLKANLTENSVNKFFIKTTYKIRGKEYPEYIMNRDGFALLVMGFTGKAALEWKLKYINAFNEMQKQLSNPQLEVLPRYKTRMIGTAVRDIGKTAESIEQVYAVKHGMALAVATNMIGNTYGFDTTPLKRLLPAEENPGYMNPTALAEKAGMLSKNGKPNGATANKKLADLGLQTKKGRDWRLTDKGREYGEEKPYSRNGHTGYAIAWNEKVLKLIEKG